MSSVYFQHHHTGMENPNAAATTTTTANSKTTLQSNADQGNMYLTHTQLESNSKSFRLENAQSDENLWDGSYY